MNLTTHRHPITEQMIYREGIKEITAQEWHALYAEYLRSLNLGQKA